MNSWAKSLNRAVMGHDSLLFVQESKEGRYDLYRKSQFGSHLPHFIFSLTDTWQPTGKPIAYGIEVVLNRIKAHDMWRDDTFVERWIQEHQKNLESKERARKNSIESFLYDFHSQFKKTMQDVDTSNMKKLYREEGTHGYREPRP